MIGFAKNNTGACGFFQGVDGEQAFHKNFEELHEAAVLLHGNDQRVVFLAEMLLHELRGLPIH